MDLESNRSIEPDTIYRIYSMTKPVTSVAVMMLYEEGHFQLDDPVAEFILELGGLEVYAGGDGSGLRLIDQTAPISIRHLLTHAAGLTYPVLLGSPQKEMFDEADLLRPAGDLKDVVGKLASLPLVHQPGTT